MRRSVPAGLYRVRSGLHGPDPIPASAVRSEPGEANKGRVQGSRVLVARMAIPADAVGLPDDEPCPGYRLAVTFMHTSCSFDDIPLGSPLAALRDRQVAARLRRPSDRRVGAENLVGRTLPERVSGRIVDIGARTTVGRRRGSQAGAICHIIALGAEWMRPHSSGLNPDAFTIGPQRSMSALISRANSAGELPAGSKDSLSRPALTSRVFSASRTAGPSLPTISAGGLSGRKMPNPATISNGGYPASLIVRSTGGVGPRRRA